MTEKATVPAPPGPQSLLLTGTLIHRIVTRISKMGVVTLRLSKSLLRVSVSSEIKRGGWTGGESVSNRCLSRALS